MPHNDDPLNEDGASDIPLHRLPGFGTGLHRQRVAFVKAGAAADDATTRPATDAGSSIADVYLSIVMGGRKEQSEESITSSVCDVCHLPAKSTPHPHDASLVHQVALGHSKPPSAIDRNRFGLAIMAAQGWDPDSGRGLGREQQGPAHPIAAKARPARQALGDHTRAAADDAKKKERDAQLAARRPKTKQERRRAEDEKRRRHERLHAQIMGNRELGRYL